LNLFEWLVKNTKQELRFHVVLGTSDSFFHLWIEKFIGASRFKSYVVGNLSREEAGNFWTDKLLTRNNLLKNISPPSFDHAYEACGGNIYLLEQYFSDYCLSKGALVPAKFYLVRAERVVLVRAFRKSERRFDHQKLLEPPRWSKEAFVKIIKMLVDAKGNFLVYDDLSKEFGESVVDALIEENILHLRPTEEHSYDIPNHPDSAIVTAETPSSLLAMKRMLLDIEQDKM